ncbi:unnamed protein product [Lymnaea stagnalis]|uniref:THD domain-containing protein n=1 Tax=Lymnaea stagnalis TaxID=6523 RepID=A0AAV2IFF3_LYMST
MEAEKNEACQGFLGRGDVEGVSYQGNSLTNWGKCVKICSGLLTIAAFLLSVAALVLASVYTPSRAGSDVKQANPSNYSVCVRCERFKWSTSPTQTALLDQIDKVENGEKCCARNQTQLKALYDLVMNRTLKPAAVPPPVVNPTNFSMSRASLHKKLVPSSEENKDNYPYFHPDNEAFPLYFAKDETTPLLEHTRNMELMTTGMPISKPGAYLVYCSVAFKPDSAQPCRTFAQQTWSVNITRVRPNDVALSGVILTAKHTCCDDCVRNQETSYTAGVFLLKEHDLLRVDVSGEGLVSYKPQSTFFGVTMLTSVDT